MARTGAARRKATGGDAGSRSGAADRSSPRRRTSARAAKSSATSVATVAVDTEPTIGDDDANDASEVTAGKGRRGGKKGGDGKNTRIKQDDKGNQDTNSSSTSGRKRGRSPAPKAKKSTRTKKPAAAAGTANRKSKSKKDMEKSEESEEADGQDEDSPEESTPPSRRRRVGSRSRAAAPSTPSRGSTPTRSGSRSSSKRGAASKAKSYSEADQDGWFEEMLVESSSSDSSSSEEDDGNEDDVVEENESDASEDDNGGGSKNNNKKRRGRGAGSSNNNKKKAAAKKPKAKKQKPVSNKKQKAKKKKTTPKKKGADATAESSSVQHVCKYCNKSFRGENGLSYHLKNKVCKQGAVKPRDACHALRDKFKGKGGKYGPKEMRTCPYCDKVFSIVSGLAYHLEHKVCQRAAAAVTDTVMKAKAKGARTKKKKGLRIPKEVEYLAGKAPYPKLSPGERFVTQFGVAEVVADDRIPADYGKTKIGGYDTESGEVDEDRLKEAGTEFKRYQSRTLVFAQKNRDAYGSFVRSNLRKRRRLGRHYAKEAGLDQDEGSSSAAAASSGTQEQSECTTQMAVWRESVKNTKLTPDAILNHGATYDGYSTRDKAKAEALANSPHVAGISFQRRGTGIKIEDSAPPRSSFSVASLVEQPKNPLAPDDSYPDRIVTCRLVLDKRKRIYDYDDPAAALKKTALSSMGKMDSAWDIVFKAQAEAKRAKAEEKSKGKRRKKKKAEGVDATQEKRGESGQDSDAATGEDEEDDNPPVISQLCLRRCLLTVPYAQHLPVFICRECGKTFNSRVGLKDHVLNRTCLPPESESESDKDEKAEEEDASDIAETPKVLEGSGIKLRRRRSRKRKKYVEVGSDDDEQAGGKDDEEWDAAANDDANDEEDDVISVVSEKEDEPLIAAEEPDADPDVLVVDAVPSRSSNRTPAKKRRRVSGGASVSTAKSRGRLGQSTKHFRALALDGFDPDGDDSSVEIRTARTPRKTPVKNRFGIDPNRRLSRKEWQRLKRPGWMHFKPEVSTWYPEIMKTLGLKRGSNNMNWRKLTTNKRRFEAVKSQRNERRAKVKLGNSPVYREVLAHLNLMKGVANKGMYTNVFEHLGFKLSSRNQSTRPNRRNRDCPALCICGDEDQNYERRDRHQERLEKQEQRNRRAAERQREKAEGKSTKRKRRSVCKSDKNSSAAKKKKKRMKRANPPPPIATTDPSSKDFSVHAFRTPKGPMIDLNVLVEEIDSGRFPSMKRYNDDHIDVCEICMEDNADDEDEEGAGRGPIYGCAFCSNAEHLSCLLSKYNVHDWDEHDDFICHSCLATCLHRRHRAERRRLAKGVDDPTTEGANEPIRDSHSPLNDDEFAVMDIDNDDIGDMTDQDMLAVATSGTGGDVNDLGMPRLAIPDLRAMFKGDAAEEVIQQAENGTAHANTILTTAASSQAAVGDDYIDLGQAEHQTHSECPEGGPGGLVCCRHCASSYSRILSSTTKEMEAQTVAKVGKEVGELMELLVDAQTRLRLAVDVSRENDVRRRTLDM